MPSVSIEDLNAKLIELERRLQANEQQLSQLTFNQDVHSVLISQVRAQARVVAEGRVDRRAGDEELRLFGSNVVALVHETPGVFTITFSPPVLQTPVVLATSTALSDGTGNPAQVFVREATLNTVQIETYVGNSPSDAGFSFVIIGDRDENAAAHGPPPLG